MMALLALLAVAASAPLQPEATELHWRSAALAAAGLASAENELALVTPSALRFALSSNYTLTVADPAPGVPIADGQLVTLAYTSTTPARGDWLGVYTSTQDPSQSVPLKYARVDTQDYLASGQGARTLQLIALRSARLTLYLFSGGLGVGGVARAALNLSLAGDVLAPQRPRLTAENASHLRVTWSSGRAPAAAAPQLSWGLDASASAFAPPVASAALARSDLCGAPANASGWLDLGHTHSALLDLRLAGTPRPAHIYYRLRDAASPWGNATRARVPRAAPGGDPSSSSSSSSSQYPYTLLAFDDMGRGSADQAFTWSEYGRPALNTSLWLTQHVEDQGGAEAVWLVGDLSYATGYLAVWEWWLFMVSPWAARIPLLLGVGNHESGQLQLPGQGATAANHFSYFSSNDAGGECGIVTTHLTPLPGAAARGGSSSSSSSSSAAAAAAAQADQPWWALPLGPFYLITLSSEHSLAPASSQLAWLAATLPTINRTTHPFLLLGIHRPMYIDSTYATDSRGNGTPDTADTPVAAALQAALEPLTMRHKVTLALYGHNHAVQRLSPAYRNVSTQRSVGHVRGDGNASALYFAPRATMHYVIGTGGAGFTANCAACSASNPLPPPSFSERVFYAWGLLRLVAVNGSCLEVDWVDSSSGVVVDRMTLVQELGQAWVDEGGGRGGAAAAAAGPVSALTPGATAAVCMGVLAAVAAGALWVRRGRGGSSGSGSGSGSSGSGATMGRSSSSGALGKAQYTVLAAPAEGESVGLTYGSI